MPEFESQLKPFAFTHSLPIELTCVGNLTEQHKIDICFTLTGDLSQISLDATSTTGQRKDNLWEKTCFELFVKNSDSQHYWEYNLSPSSNWAVYGFTGYRSGKFDELSIESVPISSRIQSNQYILNSQLALPEALLTKNLEIGLSTVVQDKNGDIYYYALEHMNNKPDFHNPESFIIKIGN